MSKEQILEEFDKLTPYPEDCGNDYDEQKEWLVKNNHLYNNEVYNEPMYDLSEEKVKEFIEKAIDQTREETIKKTLKEIRDYIRDNEKLGYENRVLVGDEIYAKLSIIYDKSLINK